MIRWLLSVGLVVVTATGCSVGSPQVAGDAEPSPSAAAGDVAGQLAESYSSIAALSRAADLIVIGEIDGNSSKTYGNLPFTDVLVRPTRTLKGVAPAPLTVLETGGLLEAHPKLPGAVPGSPIPASFEGVPVMAPGERYVLFLRGYQGPITADAWVILGVVQGKFAIGRDDVIRFAGSQSLLASALLAAPREANLLPLSEVVRRISAAL